MSAPTRRELVRWLGAGALLVKLPACGGGDSVFTGDELTTLRGFADVIIPPDDQPGGAALGAVAFIEALLGALSGKGPARIYAGGPFSDRNPNPDGTPVATNDFATFIELDRVLDAAWRARIPELETELKSGLAAAHAMVKGTPNYQALYDAQPAEFQQLIFDLVTQAAWAAPEYGGNPKLAGWKMVHFEGDSLPLGYTQFNGTGYDERADAPMSGPNASDPEPLTSDVDQLLATVVAFLGGRNNA